MQLTEKQLSALKDFDLDMFKNGTKIIVANFPSSTAEFVAEDNTIVIARNEKGQLCSLYKDCIYSGIYGLKMLPLFFVEDKPVYPGDVLYYKWNGDSWLVSPDEHREGDEKYLTWNKPKVKKEAWVNLYRCAVSSTGVDLGSLYETEDIAVRTANGVASYIKTIRIEWEE